jgi:predicted nucleic acid-binding protein
MRLCLDTSAYSRFKVGDGAAVQHLDGASWVGMPTVVVGELEAGFRLGGRAEANLDELEQFLAQPVVELLHVDRDVASLFAQIVVQLRARGTPIPTNDIWIAACAARSGAPLLTYDRHFRAVDRIGVVVVGD